MRAMPPAYLGRGLVHRQKGQLILALQDFNKAIALRPNTAQTYYNRGLLYQGQRQHQFAIDDFSTAIGLSPQQAEPLIARALSYLALERRQGGSERSRRSGACRSRRTCRPG